ncbi:hypothetical protein [Brucella intermedia]|nr:hypothetical protein [Brucella intermedia]
MTDSAERGTLVLRSVTLRHLRKLIERGPVFGDRLRRRCRLLR